MSLDPEVKNTSFEIDSYSSSFGFQVIESQTQEPMIELIARFISPITPHDFQKQSIPFSYLELSIQVLDSKSHSIQIYTDINGLWLSDQETESLVWSSDCSPSQFQSISLQLDDQRPFQESFDRILNGQLWYATSLRSHQSSVQPTLSTGLHSIQTRHRFSSTGSLFNSSQSNPSLQPQPITTRDQDHIKIHEPVFAFSHDLGILRSSSSRSKVLMAIGHVRDPIVQYMTQSQSLQPLRPLWSRRFGDSIPEMLMEFFSDFETQLDLSEDFHQKLMRDSIRLDSSEYGHLLSISTRQIFQALESVWDEDQDLEMVMLKEISSNGNCQTLDVLMPLLPFLIYAEPNYIPAVLEPIYRYVSTGLYSPLPPPHDLGDHYPNVTGRNEAVRSTLPLEESGNLISMAYAGILLNLPRSIQQTQTYWNLIQQWASWMEHHTLFPYSQSQLSIHHFIHSFISSTFLISLGL